MKIISAVLLLIVNINVFSQGEAAVPFLTISVSPSIRGIGGAASSLPTHDPYAVLENPAQLGFFSREQNIGYSYSGPLKNPFMPESEWSGKAFSFGYNLNNITGLPLSIGFAWSQPEIIYGKFPITNLTGNVIGYFESKDYSNTYTLAAGYDYFIRINAGLSYKEIHSVLSSEVDPKFSAIDYGFLITAPVLELIDPQMHFQLSRHIPAVPFFDFSLGYSKLNNGDDIWYIDPAQKDPLPRTAKTGFGISTGADLKYKRYQVNLIKFEFTSEAEDLLIERDETGKFDYQSGFGDISWGGNVIGAKGNDNVMNRKGFSVSLVDLFGYRNGKFSIRDMNVTSEGFEFRAKGLLTLFASMTDLKLLNYLADHFDVKYYTSTFLNYNKKISGFTFLYSGLRLF